MAAEWHLTIPGNVTGEVTVMIVDQTITITMGMVSIPQHEHSANLPIHYMLEAAVLETGTVHMVKAELVVVEMAEIGPMM